MILDSKASILPAKDIDGDKLGPLIRITGKAWTKPRRTISQAWSGNRLPPAPRATTGTLRPRSRNARRISPGPGSSQGSRLVPALHIMASTRPNAAACLFRMSKTP